MNPDDLPENLGRPMPQPDRLTVEDHIFLAAITGLLASRVNSGSIRMMREIREALLDEAKAIARQAMEAR
jgi:hypothetical protein